MENYQKEYELWLNDPYFSEKTKEELRAIQDNKEAIYEQFYQNLSFGTAGLRGVLGAGTNRMNEYTVAQAAEGFARYLDSLGEEKKRGIAISYDSRHRSQEFAQISASIFAKHEIPVYIFTELHPVSLLSFAIRYFNCIGGVMVTASHNPSKYNGYKVYGEDGGQITEEIAEEVSNQMRLIRDYRSLEWLNYESVKESSFIHEIGEELDDAYTKMLLSLSISPDIVAKHADMKIVYTPIHGSGNKLVRRALQSLGFQNVSLVEEQLEADGNFPTVSSPNPEERSALAMAIALAKAEDAQIVLATDPDADRTGLAVRLPNGEYEVMTGNQIGILLMDYILSSKVKQNKLEENSFCVTTIVSTRLAQKIAENYGVKLYTTLTGFKYIAEKIHDLDENGHMHFQFGFEESFGYLAGTSVRDKDAVVACMLLAELAAVCAEEQMSLYDRLQNIYQEYGFASERTVSIVSEGSDGSAKIQALMKSLREENTNEIAGITYRYRRDYLEGVRVDSQTKEKEKLDTPSSNVLLYELDGIDWMCVRPSGTEPKVKIYFGAYDNSQESAEEKRALLEEKLLRKVHEILEA